MPACRCAISTLRAISFSRPAGIGKSRLAWEFEKYVDGLAEDIRWHRGRCLSYGEGVAYWALAEMVRGLLEGLGLPVGEQRPDAVTELEPLPRLLGHQSPEQLFARDPRYGLHYMFSDDNLFEDNLFENGAAGAALMYSRRILFRRNRFLHNRGFASVGLLLKACDDVTAESNLIADNARGIFLEGSSRNVFRGNLVAESDAAIVLYDSCSATRFDGNSFVQNLTPLEFVGRRTDTVFDGNYWSENDVPDLDGDGRSDRPYRLSSAFDHFRGNLTAADLFTQGIGATALAAAERAFPVLDPSPVEDRAPLARPPALARVPRPSRDSGRPNAPAMAVSAAAAAAGILLLGRGRP